jgi:NitT/TauT family transport system ATP-binding protein
VSEQKPRQDPDILVECTGLSHWFDTGNVLYDVNLKIARGEFVALVGATGAGKTTLLRAILGTHPPKDGQVIMNGTPVTGPGRDRGIVYQRYSLFPFMTVRKNVAFGLKLDQIPLYHRVLKFWKYRSLRKQHLKEAEELLRKFQLDQELHKYPSQLSGGQSQRVAVAQALIMKPEIVLLDEPFGALDEATRERLQDWLLELRDENLKAVEAGRKPLYTVILVTHELREAIRVADRVVALSRHWLWEAEGLPDKPYPGATIVYDAAAPEYRDLNGEAAFLQQRRELIKVAFPDEKRDPRGERGEFVRFWREYEQGKAYGVLAR